MHDALIVTLRYGEALSSLQHLHLELIFVKQTNDFDVIVVKRIVNHEILSAQGQNPLHVFKFN